jgi:hypothetical protein
MKKTKIIITESQYNRLILEQSYSLDDNDVLILNMEPKKDSDGDDMPTEIVFGVIDAIGDDIIMINCNKDGYSEFKNDIFATNLSKDYDKSKGQLLVYRVNKKNIKTIEEFKEELKLRGKKYTFGKTRKIVDIETEKDNASSLGCNLFKLVKDEPDETFKDFKTGLLEVTFKDGSTMNINVFEKRGTKLLFDFEYDENDNIVKLSGDAEKFVSKLRGENFKYFRYGIIDSKDLSKLNENDTEPLVDLIYQKDDKELKVQYPLTDIKSINISTKKSEPKEKDEKDKTGGRKLSSDDYKKILQDNPILMKALLQRPGLIGSFFNMPETGLVATEDMLGVFSKYIEKNKKKIDFLKFKSDNVITYRLSSSGGELKGLVAKSKFKDKGNVYIYTNANQTVPTEKDYKYKLKLLKDFDKDVNNDKYGVEYTMQDKDGNKEKKETTITVISYTEKEEKK